MNTVIVNFKGLPVETLRPVAEEWLKEAHGNALGIETDVDRHLADLRRLSLAPDTSLIALFRQDEPPTPLGYIGIEFFQNPIGHELVAQEKYWYVIPEARGRDSVRLLKEAKRVAVECGAKFMLFSASNLASGLHDQVCSLYRHMKMDLFETTFSAKLDQGLKET